MRKNILQSVTSSKRKELAGEFSTLPPDFQKVLRLSQETHNIKITPLQKLSGGQTGANLYLVSVSPFNSNKVQHFVLKLDRKNKKSKLDELERHRSAVNKASAEFAHNHIPQLSFNRIEVDNTIAIFYKIAGESLQTYKPLASYQQQKKIEIIFSTTQNILLKRWNTNPVFEQAIHPQEVLSAWLGYRLNSGSNIENFLEKNCQIQHDTAGLLIEGNVFPNPLVYARRTELWGEVRPIDIILGFQHGDLNIGNILVKFNGKNEELTGYYLIDFALFKSNMPLFYDNLYLQLSYLIRELSRVNFPGWIDMVNRFANEDILNPNEVPIELSGACAVINAGRKEFNNWVYRFHPSLSDDLWGQFWLAAVAVGLNYCNKQIISDTERLAGLIFAASHLKRFHRIFGVSLPSEVKHINIITRKTLNVQFEKSNGLPLSGKTIDLPIQSTTFIGREKEIIEASNFLKRDTVHLLTFTGPGGTGKTRLAIQLATSLTDHFKDGIYFVDLVPVREPESVLTTIARTIGLKETSDKPIIDELGKQFHEKKLLLLLDNFEQLIDATPYIVELLNHCPQLRLLVTSREALHIRGEQVFPVSPLSVPDAEIYKQPVEKVRMFESVQLFVERASAVRPDFELTIENAPVVAKICSRLDGLPLAIELTAARMILFSPQDLLKRLDNRLKLLRGGIRDLPVRHQTLEDAINWSYTLLSTGEQRLFALLSVFHGFTIEQVEAVTEGIKKTEALHTDTIEVLTSLLNKSLIHRIQQDTGKQRFQMLETIREYATEKLAQDPKFNATASREHAIYFADFSQLQWKRLTSDERVEALKEFETNIENVQFSWHYWVAESDFEQLQKLTDCLWLLFNARGWYSAIVELTTDLLKVLGSTPSTPERSRQEIMLQTSLGRVLMAIKGCTPDVEEIYKHALVLCKKYGEVPKSFPILRALASFYVYVGDLENAINFGEQILSLAEKLNDASIKIEGYLLLGYSIAFTGNLHKGVEYLEKGIAVYKPDLSGSHSFKFGNNPGIISHTTSALCSWMLGYHERSRAHTDRALALAEKLDHPSSKIYALFHTGLLHHYNREDDIALKHSETALKIAENYDFEIWKAVATCLHGAALAGTGPVEDGIIEFNHGFEMYSELKTPPIFWPLLLLLKAVVYMQAQKPKEGLEILDEASSIIGKSTGNPLLSELYRLKGDLLLMISPNQYTQAEAIYKESLNLARMHKTVTFELRTAVSVSRLWIRKSKRKQVRQLLSETLKKFTEEFESLDLKEAKDILSEVS